MASASTKQLLRSSEVVTTMLVFPGALLLILALFSTLRWVTPSESTRLIDTWVTGLGVLSVALGNGHAFLATVANYKAGGVLKRLAVTPISPVQMILGDVIPRTAMGMVTIIVFLAVGRALGADLRIDAGIIAIVPVMAVVTVTGLSVAFVIAGRTNTPQTANAVDSSISFPLYLFTGAMFPLAAFPDWLQTASHFLPYTGLIATVRGVALDGRPITDFGTDFVVAGAWLVLLLAAAARAYRFVA